MTHKCLFIFNRLLSTHQNTLPPVGQAISWSRNEIFHMPYATVESKRTQMWNSIEKRTHSATLWLYTSGPSVVKTVSYIFSLLKMFLIFDFDPEIHFQGQSVLGVCSYMLSRCDGYIEANEEITGRLLHFIMQGKQSQENKNEQLISLYTGHPVRKNKRVTNRTAPCRRAV